MVDARQHARCIGADGRALAVGDAARHEREERDHAVFPEEVSRSIERLEGRGHLRDVSVHVMHQRMLVGDALGRCGRMTDAQNERAFFGLHAQDAVPVSAFEDLCTGDAPEVVTRLQRRTERR
jgi:hypothetical protein